MHSDPVADMLTRIRNGAAARKKRVDVPRSNLKIKISEILKAEGYLDDYRVIEQAFGGQGAIELKLAYDHANEPVVVHLERLSKPGLRKYVQHKEIPQACNGLGIVILTTSQGVLTDRQARKAGVGGEALCAVW